MYVFIDPFNNDNSGVSTYTKYASDLLKSKSISTITIARNPKEKLESFRLRVPKEIAKLVNVEIIESPETGYATKHLKNTGNLHIRLHCSKVITDKIQGLNRNEEDLFNEQKEINKATHVSSPSFSGLEASKYFFEINGFTHCFPNPSPVVTYRHTQRNGKVLFIGRWQNLKGIEYLKNIIDKKSDTLFSIITDRSIKGLPKNATQILPTNNLEKLEIISEHSALIVPSLYESASMVGLEALSTNTPIIAWNHLGICEYTKENNIYSAPPFSLDDLYKQIDNCLESHTYNDTSTYEINSNYADSIINLITKNRNNFGRTILNPPDPKNLKENIEMTLSREHKGNSNPKNPYVRKARKLLRDPAKFFADSKAAQYLTPPGKGFTNKDLEHPAFLDASSLKKNNNYNSVTIRNSGKVTIDENIKIRNGEHVLYLYTRGNDEDLLLSHHLNNFVDFRPLRKGELISSEFEINSGEEIGSIINRIDNKNKTKLSEFSYIILKNPPENLVKSLKLSTTGTKIIVISNNYSSAINPEYIDCLISKTTTSPLFKRAFSYEKENQIPKLIRKYIQDTLPKDINLFLRVGENNLRIDINESFSSKFDGIIFSKEFNPSKQLTMNDLVKEFSQSGINVFLRDTTLMEYKSLVDICVQTNNFEDLISRAIKDGVRFDVRT